MPKAFTQFVICVFHQGTILSFQQQGASKKPIAYKLFRLIREGPAQRDSTSEILSKLHTEKLRSLPAQERIEGAATVLDDGEFLIIRG